MCFTRKSGFCREERLKKRNEIREVFSKGKRIGCRGAKLFVLQNSLPYNRICFTFSRNFGTSVQRNRAKRLGREAYRSLKHKLRCGYDLILLTYPETPSQDGAKLMAQPTARQTAKPTLAGRVGQLRYLFSRAGLWL